MKIESIKVNDAEIRYFRFGNENGQPFVIIPGVAIKSVMDSAEFIAAQYNELAEIFNVYVFDRRENMPEGFTIIDMAEDTAAAMKALRLDNSIIYGVSQGGMIAQVIAAGDPELISRLVLCSTAPYISENAEQIISEWRKCAEKNDISGLMKSFSENVYSAEFCERCSNVFTEFAKQITEDDLKKFVIAVSAMDGFDMREQLCGIRCPVLVQAGDSDRIFGTSDAEDLSALTGGELCIFKGQAHAVYDEEPAVITRILKFAM